MDSMAVGPGSIAREDFFKIMSALLKNEPRASKVTVIEEAFVFSFPLRCYVTHP